MTSCRTTAVWLGTNNSQSVLVHPTFLSSVSATADHSLSHILPSSPACLRSAGAQLPMISRALDIKSGTVWKDLQDGVERTIQGFAATTGVIQETPSSVSLCRVFPCIQHSSLVCGTGGCRWHHDSSVWWLRWRHTWNDARRRWNTFL